MDVSKHQNYYVISCLPIPCNIFQVYRLQNRVDDALGDLNKAIHLSKCVGESAKQVNIVIEKRLFSTFIEASILRLELTIPNILMFSV